MNFSEYLNEDHIFIAFKAENKQDFLEKAVKLIIEKFPQYNRAEILELYLKREKTMATAIGKKIAIPHIVHEKCDKQSIFIFSLDQPIDFQARDQQWVKVIIMLLGPITRSNFPYLQVLAKISRVIRNNETVEKLINASSSSEIYQTLLEYGNS